jgi:hypothetical protein
MTDLSPAAQAVASAYDNTPEKDTDNHRYLWLAAALRAAADEVGWDWEPCSQLLSIADELEGVTYGTYRCNLEDK